MKWSDIAPEGTNVWCNQWRERYRTMPFSQHQSDTDSIMVGHATPEQATNIDSRDLRSCLSGIDCGRLRVIEFGGWRGAMANAVLSDFKEIESWTNYDLAPSALNDSHCDDPRYECSVPFRFLWETSRLTRGDIFCSSHAIEHLTAEHLNLLFRWLPDSIRWMYLCAPIQDSCTDETWKDYGGTHILEIGWEQVLALLPNFRLLESGEQFRWLGRIADIPPVKCGECAGLLVVTNDYVGGGSHYWALECSECKRRFIFDTYRFKLEEVHIA